MIHKSLKITRCSQCHYAYWDSSGFPICSNTTEAVRLQLPSTSEIPDWCPLEDWRKRDIMSGEGP